MYANLAGDVVAQAKALVEAMGRAGVKRLVWISSLGIYNEIPGAFGEWNNQMIGSALITEIISSEDGWDSERNLGINKPGTDGDKPAWY